jgi:ubiquinone/menaquinone biosynthesis C-methylase UbiE
MNHYENMTAERYLKLYARFQNRAVEQFVVPFIDMKYKKSDTYLDLCCGPAQVARCLLELGFKKETITTTDIVDFRQKETRQLSFYLFKNFSDLSGKWNHIFCRQAVLY